MTAWIPDVVADQTIQSTWGNMIRDRTITPFANAAARDAALTGAMRKTGMVVYLIDTKRTEQWDGAAWSLPWWAPWGIIKPVVVSGSITLQTGVQVLPGMGSIPLNSPIGRAVRFCIVGTAASSGGNADTQIGIQRNTLAGTEYYGAWRTNVGGGAGGVIRATVSVSMPFRVTVVNQLAHALGVTFANTALWEGGSFWLEDVGPAPAGM